MSALDPTDRRIVVALQGGLPLVAEPYRAVATDLGLSTADLMARLRRLRATGAIRRIGAVPNHYALGYRANGMSVWDVADERVGIVGPLVGALDYVSHCYRRPRHPPHWPYNLFAMVHGHDRETVERHVAAIAEILGPDQRRHEVLYSTRNLKKTGLRLAA